MDQTKSCQECRHSITERGYKCADCSTFLRKEVFYCQRCFTSTEHETLQHDTISVDYTQTTNTQLINSIIAFENLHLATTTDELKLFPHDDQDSAIWKRNNFSEISYILPKEIPFKNVIPFVCDYLRMNNSLKYLIDKLNLKLCSTDVIILILKYTSFDIRLLIIEQLCIFQRAIPIYFGVPSLENFSMKYYFLMQEMSHILLPYKYQKTPFILSFGTQSCKGKTLLLNTILKTNFDCHYKAEFNFEVASTYYHHQLIQVLLGHQYDTDRGKDNEITRAYQCHVLDLHGTHDWKQMPSFFIEFMSVIIIHMDILDAKHIDSLLWPTVVLNQTATYIICIHGEISDSDIEEHFRPQILKHFGLNKKNVHMLRAKAILHENNKILQTGVLVLLKQASNPTNSLLNVSEQLIQLHNINLSTSIDTLSKSRQLLDEFDSILNMLSSDDPALDLFPLSRLRELSEKANLSSVGEQQKNQLTQKLYDHGLDHANTLLTKLAELVIEDNNDIVLFEKAILLWNTTLWHRKRQEVQRSPTSILQQLEMSKERFLREFQERSMEYTDRNGRLCSFKDTIQMKTALIKIYQHSFRSQEYIEIINATSSTIYPKIFHETFSNIAEDLKEHFVIGIIGEQSGGKSFLVNKVFGTKIAESKFKCTTGILATRVNVTGHESVKNIVILDTEGLLDQSKKDAEAQIFDRKMVLAVMARSHVVMINITRNVNKTMQQILEIVFYGLNKLQITNKPKMIFLFRDQDPKSMGEAGQRNHVSEVMNDINTSCNKVSLDVQKVINGFDIHEFPSPFVDLLVGDREISFFSNSFCQKALSLRLKIIDQLANLTPFNSFDEWLATTLDLWQQINHNSNLFDYESLVHLTLERELEMFSNRVLTEANREMREMVDSLTINARNRSDDNSILHEIERKLIDTKTKLANDLLSNQLINEKKRLMQKHNLQAFPEALFESTKLRIESSLNLYKADHHMAATRQFQQDEFQKRLSEIPKQLSIKIRDIQSVVENTAQFEELFNNTSGVLLAEFINLLENDVRKQSIPLNNTLIQNFLKQNQIDQVGVTYVKKHINDSSLTDIVRKVILRENLSPVEEQSLIPATQQTASSAIAIASTFFGSQHGSGILRSFASFLYHKLFSNKQSNNNVELQIEKMLSFLKVEYTVLQNSPYYDSNMLPIPELANDCVQHIRNAIEKSNIQWQEMKNIWYTCYGIMLNIFCDEHYNYINKKLISEFEQEISRTKEEVRQNIVNASTAEEHGQAVMKQIWTIIQNDTQKQFQNQFERFFVTWDEYSPSIVSENCVNQLFRSINYQLMLNYIRNPTTFITEWLRSEFNKTYQNKLNQTIHDLSLHLEETKRKFDRMVLSWAAAIQANPLETTVSQLTNSLKEFLSKGEHKGNNISLTELTGGFPILDSSIIRTVPETADKHRLLKAIQLACSALSADDADYVKQTTKKLIINEQYANRLFDRFYNKAKGCGTPCPYCKQICDNDNPTHTEHRTEHHLFWVFGGYRARDTEKPSLICCTSNEAFKRNVQSLREKDTYLPFPDHLKQFNPTWNIINKMTPLQDFLLKAYIALEEELAQYYKFNGRADMETRKKFLRSTVTAHCYALLVGIDYENTPNSLHGIPSNDVACIKQQLEISSIASPENLHVLKNNQATKGSILNKFNTIVNNMDQRSTFIFYFSGHGGRTVTSGSYLLASDNQMLTTRELAAVFDRAMTTKIIIILDSCYSGGMSNAFRFDSNNFKQGIHILCSSSETQVSYQSVSDGNGFFTKHLIKGLKGEFSCQTNNCNECTTRTENLQRAVIRKVTSTELASYLNHAISGRQNFAYSVINGSDFDISFLN
ncbi:unnamed protein product [Rotaria socialis]|uniref:Uncharacterized protein n=1 Tax=Rotaria socialis TaxID=392032 RepID=A0A821DNP1_9BILA|nr:unnamed protein product [Rotaria socialis]CAF4624246.1 unnamed protein product [Rotaria socialis]